MSTVTGQTDLDVDLMSPSLRIPVSAGPVLRQSKWRGGLWVTYITSTEGDFVVEVSDGNTAAGFLLFSSEKYSPLVGGTFGPAYGSPNNWTSYQPALRVGGQNVVTMCADNARAFFRMFETVALAGGTRSGGAITYALNETLKVSENGLLCNDSDGALALAGIATPIPVGIVSAIPSAGNFNRLGVDIHF